MYGSLCVCSIFKGTQLCVKNKTSVQSSFEKRFGPLTKAHFSTRLHRESVYVWLRVDYKLDAVAFSYVHPVYRDEFQFGSGIDFA